MTISVGLAFRSGSPDEDLTPHVLVVDGITVKRGKQQAFGATEITTCSFTAKRSIMKTAAWRLVTRTTEDIRLTVDGSARFTGWWWRVDEDIFDERGVIRITLASSPLKSIIEDVRELRFSTRALPNSSSDTVAYCPVDDGLIRLNLLLDDQDGNAYGAAVTDFSPDASGASFILDPPSNVPQLRAGPRNTYTTDARLLFRPTSTVSAPFQVFWVMNASPASLAAAALSRPFAVWTGSMSFRFGVSSTGLISSLVRDEDANTALVNTSTAWAGRTTQAGELWMFQLQVSTSGANVTTTLNVYPLSRPEGPTGDTTGTVIVSNTSAAPAAGVGSLNRIEFGPAQTGLYAPADLLLSDILVQDAIALGGGTLLPTVLSGLGLTSLTADWMRYYATTSSLNPGTYTTPCPTIPVGTGADQLAAIEEVHRTVVRDSRTVDGTAIRTGPDYVPCSVTELALGDDYLRGSGAAGEEGDLDVSVPDWNYPSGSNPYGAEWQRNRSKRWARLPVSLDSTDKRAVDVGASLVSFYTRPGNIWRGRVVGTEETVMPATHFAFWVLEEWPHAGQLQADSAVAVNSDGSATAATVDAAYTAGGGSLTVDATYAYPTPFTVRPSAASRSALVISGISGTTWTINTGSSTLLDDLAVDDLLYFDNAAIAY